MLAQLASHYWRPDFSPAQAAGLTADYCEDLADCTVAEIEVAIRDYRRGADNQFFPKIGQLRDLIATDRKHRAELERLGKPVRVSSRPLMWWHRPKDRWNPEWAESQVPAGELVRDTAGAVLRDPDRV